MYIAPPPKVVIVEQYDGNRKKQTVVWSRRNRIKQIFFVGNKCFVVFKDEIKQLQDSTGPK